MNAKFNEDSRVKNPTILHLCRLGYEYFSVKDAQWDEIANIFPDIFNNGIKKINLGVEADIIQRTFENNSFHVSLLSKTD